jgi:hypothetical protein
MPGAVYTCNECTTGYSSSTEQGVPTATATLHPDLRLYNVQPRCETLDRVADVGTDAAKAQLARLQAKQGQPSHPSQARPQHQNERKQTETPLPNGSAL